MLYCSDHARNCLDQIPTLDQSNPEHVFFIERMLQVMKINGLIKMVNQSKKHDDMEYIAGYVNKFAWAKRLKAQQRDIRGYKELWFHFQNKLNSDFIWFEWDKLIEFFDKSNVIITSYSHELPAEFGTLQEVIEAYYRITSVKIQQDIALPKTDNISIATKRAFEAIKQANAF